MTVKPHSNRSHRSLIAAAASLVAIALFATGCASTSATEKPDTAKDGAYSVTDAMGTTEFASVPERIVVLDSPPLDALVSLGITPVGAPEIGPGRGFPDYLKDKLGETEPVGYIAEPDVDAIANLAPDLIIGSKVRHEALYKELSAIAPTIFADGSGTNWTEQADLTAAAVNETDKMEKLLDNMHERAKEVGKKVGAEGKTASIVRFRPDNFRLYGPETFSGSVLTSMGFDLGKRDWNEYSMMELSPELYTDINGDYIFYTNPGGDPNATTQASITALWSDLPGVKAGHDYAMDDDTWMVGIGVLGANLVIDQVEKELA